MVSFASADYLRLADGVRFNAIPNTTADALLSAAPVAAFGFLGNNPAAIAIQGSTLHVAQGQSLSLVGGNQGFIATNPDTGDSIPVPGGVTITGGKLLAPGGQINLASVASPGEVVAGTLNYVPNANGQSFGALGAVQISQKSVIDASGDGGGTVLIRGGSFVMDDSRISANVTGPVIGPFVGTPGQGIDIQVTQDAVVQNASVLETNVTGDFSSAVSSGGIRITADQIKITGLPGSFENFGMQPFTGLKSETQGAGNSGDIILRATGNIEFVNVVNVQTTSGFSSDGCCGSPTLATGNAGNVELTSMHGNVSITEGGFATIITSQTLNSSGNTGKVTISAPEGNIVLDGAFLFTFVVLPEGGRGGAVQITAKNLQVNSGIISTDNFGPLTPDGITIKLSGNLTVTGNSVIATASESSAGASAGDINITAKEVLVTEGSFITSSTFASGAGGRISIVADTLQLTNGGKLQSGSTLAPPFVGFDPGITPSGAGGTITIQGAMSSTAQSVLIDGAGSGVFTNTEGTGTGGNILVSANSISLQNGGTLSAATSGTEPSAVGGTILVKANTVTLNTGGTMTATSTGAGPAGQIAVQGIASPAQFILIDGSGSGISTDAHGSGAGGNITLNANTVTLQNAGALSAVATGTAPSATGGSITVNGEQVSLNSQALITAETNGIAPAGVVDINTGSLAINGGSQIRSNSGAETAVVAGAFSAAPTLTGGTITVQGQGGAGSQTGTITIDGTGSGIFTQSTGSRPGGDINIFTSGSVTMTNGPTISASSTGAGNAGSIQINVGNQLAMANSTVTTEANQSSGGAIKITTNPNGTVELTDSKISASVLDGTGGGGSVNIDPEFVILQNSQILANAVFGPGGNINITTNLLLPDTTSVISASSQFGQQGTISIQSPISPAGGKIIPLSQKPLIPTTLLSQRCAALAGGNISSFTVAGRDSLPAEPGGWISSPLALSLSESGDGTLTEAGPRMSWSEAPEEMPLLSLRQISPPGFLIQNFAVDSSAGCTS